ncbi:hypothetical protein BHYA_0232g00110 [Botrytis hyacinthi]|uniref:Uncharacterized protein n=1 Tax=Botrytis hyacinthi TaxID=278943 RepID=A0A4Z1G9M8_9HELO|nr:hypothetical protein BHYA_0232g00110 [Botrytis hyacinthi]
MAWKHRPKPKKQIQDTVSKSLGTESIAITNNVVPTKKSEFKGFPLDIINMLFDTLLERDELSTIICLALTCRTCWSFFQGKPWQRFVKFGTGEGCTFYEPYFIGLVETWIGPGFRRVGRESRYIQTPFLSRAVYGDFPGSKEKNLDDRWKDYQTLTSREDVTHRLIHHVPKPFSVSADEWFPLAAQQLRIQFLTWGPSATGNHSLYRCFRRSRLCQWLLSSSGDEWSLLNRKHRKTKRSNHALLAALLYLPDEAQSWHTPRRS